ncbi:hypothetical protein [Melittangium boletus]|uniref:Uncharacterized protein n=1 Tax=Melittangium boletus DSM 14713 TaxID=1294270 RepID=A0A250ISP4_9BACT|nr:hypothetical protein [Melittangium boletus]ATB34278.1 hypothetical protein MEBOL_007779 [Melittangium boletus DSM 14713]
MSEKKIVKVEPLPEEWRGREVGLMDVLIYARKRIRERRGLWSITGLDTVDSLLAFTIGWASNTQFNGATDPEWCDFQDWLRDVKHEAPPEGWHVKYLRDCDGDHERAALKFLDFVQEFIELRRRPSAQS